MQSELVYLKTQLGFALGEWQALDDATKEWYRKAEFWLATAMFLHEQLDGVYEGGQI